MLHNYFTIKSCHSHVNRLCSNLNLTLCFSSDDVKSPRQVVTPDISKYACFIIDVINCGAKSICNKTMLNSKIRAFSLQNQKHWHHGAHRRREDHHHGENAFLLRLHQSAWRSVIFTYVVVVLVGQATEYSGLSEK